MGGGTPVPHMLLAGVSVDITPVFVGALAFAVYYSPLWEDWGTGSANKYFKYKNKKRSIPF